MVATCVDILLPRVKVTDLELSLVHRVAVGTRHFRAKAERERRIDLRKRKRRGTERYAVDVTSCDRMHRDRGITSSCALWSSCAHLPHLRCSHKIFPTSIREVAHKVYCAYTHNHVRDVTFERESAATP